MKLRSFSLIAATLVLSGTMLTAKSDKTGPQDAVFTAASVPLVTVAAASVPPLVAGIADTPCTIWVFSAVSPKISAPVGDAFSTTCTVVNDGTALFAFIAENGNALAAPTHFQGYFAQWKEVAPMRTELDAPVTLGFSSAAPGFAAQHQPRAGLNFGFGSQTLTMEVG